MGELDANGARCLPRFVEEDARYMCMRDDLQVLPCENFRSKVCTLGRHATAVGRDESH